jgi:hypothetical protein
LRIGSYGEAFNKSAACNDDGTDDLLVKTQGNPTFLEE